MEQVQVILSVIDYLVALPSTTTRGSGALLCADITSVVRNIDVKRCAQLRVDKTGAYATFNVFQ